MSTTQEVNTHEINTICSFCGTGCGLTVSVEEGQISKVKGHKENPSSRGETCVKGALGWGYVYSEKRVTEPLVRKNGQLVPVSWDEALNVIAERFGAIKAEHGSDAFGCFSSSRSTNELNFLAGKFMRTVLGTNNIDSCNRT